MKKKLTNWLEQFCKKHPAAAFVRDVVAVFLDRRVSRSAAELAYYLLLSIFPMIIMVVGVVSLLPLEPEDVLGFVENIVPEQSVDIVSDYITYVLRNQGMGLFVAGLLSTMTAASAAFRGLVCISGEIYGRKAFRGVWGMVFSFLFSLLLIVMIYVSMVAVLTGSWFVSLIRVYLPLSGLPTYWPALRLTVLFSVSLLFLMGLYRVTAPGGTQHPPVLVGAIFTAVVLTLFSSAFSALISLSSRYSVVYGSLASIIVLMLWLYICGNIVVLGNVFNYVWWRHQRGLGVALILEAKL